MGGSARSARACVASIGLGVTEISAGAVDEPRVNVRIDVVDPSGAVSRLDDAYRAEVSNLYRRKLSRPS